MLRKGYRVHPLVHVTAVINCLIVVRVVELKVVETCKLAGTARGTLKVCKVALNRRTYDIVNEVNVYVGCILCGLGVNYLLDLFDTLAETVGSGVIPVEILNVNFSSDSRTSVSLVDTGIDLLGVVDIVVTCKISVATGRKLFVVVVLAELEYESLLIPREVVGLAAALDIKVTFVAVTVFVDVNVLFAAFRNNVAAVVALTVFVIVVVRGSLFGSIIATRAEYSNASKSHYQRKKQTNQFLFHVISPF